MKTSNSISVCFISVIWLSHKKLKRGKSFEICEVLFQILNSICFAVPAPYIIEAEDTISKFAGKAKDILCNQDALRRSEIT